MLFASLGGQHALAQTFTSDGLVYNVISSSTVEVGMQNAGLASGLSNIMGKITTLGLAPAVFGPMQNITGSILAAFWGRRKKGA